MPLAVSVDRRGGARGDATSFEQHLGMSIAADARIDNLAELRRALDADAGQPVARVLVRAYLKWGRAFPDRLVGDFALVLWNAASGTVLAARDPFGVRPLFHAERDGVLWFSSSVATLRDMLSDASPLDDERIVEHLLWRSRSTSATFFRDIRELSPGHVLEATREDLRVTPYWVPPEPRRDLEGMSRDEVFEELRALFRRSVERRLQGRDPVVIHVSGGLDSSSIAMAADALRPAGDAPALIGASAVFPGLPCDEGPFIDAVARAVHFPIERWDGTQSDDVDLTDPAADAPDSRMASTEGTSGDLEIAARHGARTILSGLGGDDVMMATGFTHDLIASGRWREAWASLGAGGSTWDAWKRRKRVIAQFLPPEFRRLRAWTSAEIPEWLSPRYRGVARDIVATPGPSSTLSSLVARNAWARVNAPHATRGIGAMQRKGMTRGVEYLFPYLDRELVTFLLSIPLHCLPGPVPFARIHREAFRPLLPPQVADRASKAEMTPALRNRVLRALPRIEALFSTGPWACGQYVDRDAARRFLRGVTVGTMESRSPIRSNDWWGVWRIATLEAWMRRFLLYRTAVF